MLKLHYLLLLVGLLLIQACQQKPESETQAAGSGKEYNRSDAASYNVQLGLAYLKQGDRPRAKRKLLLAIEQAPDSPSVNAAMAYFMEKTGELEEAQSYYHKAMALAPGSGAQLNNYGTFLCRQGQYQQAEKYFLQAVKDVKYENTAGAYENAGLCAMVIPAHAKAIEYFGKALEQDPSRKQSLYELVRLESQQNHNDQALAYLEKYPMLSLRDRVLLTLAADVAHKTGKIELEASYRARLHQLNNFSDNTGVKHDNDSDNG
ncbi:MULTISPECIES: type IV pilus biogenesis/stability protein PilW [Legionella]|uniref:type IV pilus biogenesis/stability protein PilW n=1 Tax=Legionella TaxID=445 RepID=UPI000F8E8286|nr:MULTISPECIES: type IV pilus biogenesis/stability protein PilW [Legionella]MCP0912874.1 type IV pilus biogenesis/stability protein PilW [Legionella sp. 27cVA30]RUQ95074.1 type IV pilus biogenesis/stability protein PilW [Legionella septentrionalis]RUR13706.1 type IV pilus biogenesis/stability protein PilW [Legionella septentrionalis]